MLEGPALIITLFVIGFILIAAEVFLPGMILGIVGFLCLIGSVAAVFATYGTSAGLLAAFVVGALAFGGFLLWLFLFPRTFVGRRFMLLATQPPDPAAADHRALLGETGEALTPLRPAGTARLGGKRVDVTAIGEFLEAGTPVEVIAADGMRISVRRKDGLEKAASPA
jgi:membrane-bound serine protease (ClpP class)